MVRQMIAGLALISSGVASAADWTLVAQCGDPGQERLYSYDANSVSRAPSSVVVKMKGDYSRLAQRSARESEMLWTFNCAEGTWVENSRTNYDAHHKTLSSFTNPSAAMRVAPTSVADKVFAVVCS